MIPSPEQFKTHEVYELQPDADQTHDYNRVVNYTLVDKTTGEVRLQGSGSFVPDLPNCERMYFHAAPNTYYDWPRMAFVPIPPKPSEFHMWDWSVHGWVDPRTIDDLRALRWGQIKSERTAREYADFEVPGVGVFDGDAESRAKIMGEAVREPVCT